MIVWWLAKLCFLDYAAAPFREFQLQWSGQFGRFVFEKVHSGVRRHLVFLYFCTKSIKICWYVVNLEKSTNFAKLDFREFWKRYMQRRFGYGSPFLVNVFPILKNCNSVITYVILRLKMALKSGCGVRCFIVVKTFFIGNTFIMECKTPALNRRFFEFERGYGAGVNEFCT